MTYAEATAHDFSHQLRCLPGSAKEELKRRMEPTTGLEPVTC